MFKKLSDRDEGITESQVKHFRLFMAKSLEDAQQLKEEDFGGEDQAYNLYDAKDIGACSFMQNRMNRIIVYRHLQA